MATAHTSAHGHDHGHDHSSHGHGHGEGAHGSVKSYIVGFILSVILTAIPFALVMSGTVPAATAVPVCFGLGIVQIVVHLVYFLHMNSSSARSWNMAAFLFTLLIVAILVVGSWWVMAHLNANMMPGAMPME
ncbi:cytochrome o ubiquinol oxidase subunit IV [Nitrospirillum iridis]|uniref:Cytochrome bo(3) ubiquinol oxidase subunit 4 n=1 Tax=Nitrospirillum iridis TaxID=765888 RepID=A0A7X0AXG6_9PROT|nr:cytochrome o ubiquinol oxidase subunit IV [Nitrospirillum iridis]MBB6251914.1 cytochrome o ubiquinol oxidase operon protein cyoD [Nitrospirillum iridis]